MPDGPTIAVKCGPPDDFGKRLVLAVYGKRSHTDRFDVDASYHRKKWREECIRALKIEGQWNASTGCDHEEAHGELESKLQAAVEAADEGESAPLASPNIVTLATVEAKPIHWFWDLYMPAGSIVLLDGDPNEGKSQIAVSIAARYSRGVSMPPHTLPTGKPGDVLLMSAEDDLERTTKPRLAAQNADMARVHHLRTVTTWEGEERLAQIPADVPIIESIVTEKRVGLVVLDVLSAFIAEGLNMNSDGDMRRALSPLSAMAERTQATILCLRHLNKREGTRSMYRGGGSVAIVGAARSAFAVAPHPEDSTQKVFCAVKHNLGPRPHSLTYSIEPCGNVSRVVWGDQTDLVAADVLKGEQVRDTSGSKTERAKDIIAELLAAGPRGSNEVLGACLEAGLSERTYHTARKALGVRSERTGFGGDGQWLLTMPANGYHHGDEF